MILAGTALWLVGQYSPMSFSMFLLAQTKQAYLISVYVGPLLSVIHTYLLQHTEIRAPRTRLGQSVWYATLLGLLTTLSLFPFLPSGYDAVLYVVPGAISYGNVSGMLGMRSLESTAQHAGEGRCKPSIWQYIRNVGFFTVIAQVLVTAGLWIGLRAGMIPESYFPRENSTALLLHSPLGDPYFLVPLTVFLSLVHTFFLSRVSGPCAKTVIRRSQGLAGGLALLASVIYLLSGHLEAILLVASALIYGWVVGHLSRGRD